MSSNGRFYLLSYKPLLYPITNRLDKMRPSFSGEGKREFIKQKLLITSMLLLYDRGYRHGVVCLIRISLIRRGCNDILNR